MMIPRRTAVARRLTHRRAFSSTAGILSSHLEAQVIARAPVESSWRHGEWHGCACARKVILFGCSAPRKRQHADRFRHSREQSESQSAGKDYMHDITISVQVQIQKYWINVGISHMGYIIHLSRPRKWLYSLPKLAIMQITRLSSRR